ncbi:MAG TPA: hypothetical protein VEX86_21570 [Longimicrobium sp.]|nr:hypothetical protein [Longimicrobium sp.]
MRHRHFLPLVLLVCATACQDAPLAPPVPAAPPGPRYALTGGTTDIRAGYDYVCALRSGRVACFGARSEGQPNGVYGASTGSFVQITTGATHACGLTTDGAVQCAGANDYGRAPRLRRAATGSYTQVSAGLSHTCALRTDGVVECWGWNPYGQAPPVKVAQAGKFTEVTASAVSTCGSRTDGVIECWGHHEAVGLGVRNAPSGAYVKLGNSVGQTNCAVTSTGVADCWGYQNVWHAGTYVRVVVGAGHHCALRSDGFPECWGYPPSWQGPGERGLTGRRWVRITAGSYHTCGLRSDGYFECFGETQQIGSDAPDVVPSADVPKSTLTTEYRIRLDWHDVSSNDQRTEIERSVAARDRSPTSWTRIATLTANSTSFTDGVPSGATYVYRLRACNGAGCSEWKESNATAVPATPPPAPSSATASGYVCGIASCAKVAWTVDNTLVETLRIERRANTGAGYGAWQPLAPQDRLATSFDDYGLTPGASYAYRVQSCNARGCSAYASSNAIVAPAPPTPPAPSSIAAYWMGNYMLVAWSDVFEETYYEVQRRQQQGTTYGAWSDPIFRYMNTTSFNDPVVPGTVYQYRVRACNETGCSAYTSGTPTRA